MKIETIISSIITASVSIVICMWQGGWKYTTSPQKEKIEEIRKIVIQLNLSLIHISEPTRRS